MKLMMQLNTVDDIVPVHLVACIWSLMNSLHLGFGVVCLLVYWPANVAAAERT